MACFFPDRSRCVFYHIFKNERQQLRPYTISTRTLSTAAWIATPQARPAGQSPAPKHQHTSTAITIANTSSVSPLPSPPKDSQPQPHAPPPPSPLRHRTNLSNTASSAMEPRLPYCVHTWAIVLVDSKTMRPNRHQRHLPSRVQFGIPTRRGMLNNGIRQVVHPAGACIFRSRTMPINAANVQCWLDASHPLARHPAMHHHLLQLVRYIL